MTDKDIGDIESQEKGTAARKNAGKPVWSFMPLQQIAMLMKQLEQNPNYAGEVDLPELTNQLGWFQARGEFKDAFRVLEYSYRYFMHVAGLNFDEASQAVIRVWEMGEKKYAKFNWMKGMPWSEIINSYQRHVMKMYNGHQVDEDSGEHHAAHLICNAMMLVHYVEHYPEGNDLPTDWFTT